MNLADNEFESVLRIQNPIHRKKLRLAIDDYAGKHSFPLNLREIRTDFVAQTLLPSWGLGQFSENFRYNLVDGRLLDQANKKLLEKSLGMSRKAHQQALLKGVELLRLFGYDVKVSNYVSFPQTPQKPQPSFFNWLIFFRKSLNNDFF